MAVLTTAVLAASPVSAQGPGTWQPGAEMHQARSGHSATLLRDGKVLVVGGIDGAGHTVLSAEILDPATGGFEPLAAALPMGTWGHTATLLPDGTVLIAGGKDETGRPRADAQLYHPATGGFSLLAPMITPRSEHTATRLRDGRVVLAGGTDGAVPTSLVEIYDPQTRAFAIAPAALGAARRAHTATLLRDGRVLIAGGRGGAGVLASAELYDATAGSVTDVGNLGVARAAASAALLLDGTVLIAGGQNTAGQDLASAETYNPETGTFAPEPAAMTSPRSGHLGVMLLHNGKVLITGGTSAGQGVPTVEVWDPVSNSFWAVSPPPTARQLLAVHPFDVPYAGFLLASGGKDAGGAALSGTDLFSYPTLRTDKDDYQPGDVVTVLGEGWAPNEDVAIRIVESNGDPDVIVTARADSAGAFSLPAFTVDTGDLNQRFYGVALGGTSLWTAQNTFTDSRTITSATITANSVTVPPDAAVSVTGGATISATVNVTTASGGGNDNWRSTTWQIGAGPVTCADHTNHDATGSFTETFNITAPASSGTYTVRFIAYQADGCTTQPSNTFTLTNAVIVQASQTITVTTHAPATAVYNTSFNVAATASSGLAVAITAGPAGVCSVTSGGSGSATVHMDSGTGTCTVSYNQAGDASFSAAPQVTENTTAQKATQAITFGAAPAGKVVGDAITVTAAGGGSGNAVTFTSQTPGTCSVNPAGTGSALHAGTCTIRASQAGNANYTAASDVDQSFSIGQASQTITFGAAPAGKVVGDSFTVTATGGGSGNAVTFVSQTAGTCSVNAAGTGSALHAGTCTIRASQAGNADYGAAPDVDQSFTVGQASQTITFGAAPAGKVVGNSFTVTATGGASGNAVTFASQTPGTCSVNAAGTGSALHAGACTIRASQAGNADYSAAPDVEQSFTIDRAGQTITFGALANKTYGDADFSVSATASSGLAVSFATQTATKCSVTGGTVHIAEAGPCTIRASQAGDSDYHAAPNVDQSFTIAKAATTTVVTVADATYDAAPHGGSAAVTGPGGLNQALTVTYTGPGDGPSTTPPTNAGGYSASAVYAETANYLGSNDTKTFTIEKATPVVTVTGGTFTYDGLAHAATVAVTGVGGVTVSGSSTLSYAGIPPTSYGPSTTPPTDAGTYQVRSVFTSADPNYKDAQGTGQITINKAATTTTVTVADATYDMAPHGGSAGVTGAGGLNQTLTATFTGISGTVYGPSNTAPTSAGSYSAAATYAETANYLGSSDTKTFTIQKATPLIAVTGGTFTFDGNPHAASALVTGVGGVTVSGSTTFNYAGIPPTGYGPSTVAPTNAGTYQARAVFTSADPNYQQAQGSAPLTITQATSSTAVTVANAVFDGAPHGGTAVVTGAGGLNQVLTVSYSGRNGTVYGPSTVAPTDAGDYTASASYAGDANHSGSSDSKPYSIAKASQSIGFGALASKYFLDPDFTVTATASSGLPVIFASLTPAVCTATTGGLVDLLLAGTCTIQVSQGGNGNYLPAPAGSQSFAVGGYTFTGFFSPIDNLPMINRVKAGQAIPIKFSLNGYQGLAIFMAGYPAAGIAACSATDPVDDIEVIATPGSSGLTYDPGSDQYHYVWKTDKAWGGGCRQLVVRLADGTFHVAAFNFTK